MEEERSRTANVRPGTPDGFQRLWTPHRMVYIQGENKPPRAGRGLPVLHHSRRGATDGLIVHRADLAYVVLNLYPYSPGSLAGVPLPARRRLSRPHRRGALELAHLTQAAMRVIRAASQPDGSISASTRAPLPAPVSRRTCINTSCLDGPATPTSFP